ncbi:MAG: class I SAM-dependent methyltransferase [Deltaproteobacteria bacterium]|nr:class I SAM-dependent methyltransferase [Deltaproteobacteria bacterium]
MPRHLRQRYYNSFSRIYDRFVVLHSTDKGQGLRRYLADKAGLHNGDTVLDICTGTASMLPALKEKVGTEGLVAGADFSMGMLLAGKSKISHHRGVFLVLADVAVLPFKDRVFDAVTCSHDFYELRGETQDRCLHEIDRVLKPDKHFLMMEHDIPKNVFVRMLFYLRLLSMGPHKASRILRHERELLMGYFHSVEKITTPTGRSKIMVCR